MSLAQIFTPDLPHVKWNPPIDALGIPRVNDPSGKMVNTLGNPKCTTRDDKSRYKSRITHKHAQKCSVSRIKVR